MTSDLAAPTPSVLPTAHPDRAGWHAVARDPDLPSPGCYVLAEVEVEGERAIVIRGRDGVVRAFHNVCRHRGAEVLQEPCGSAVRLQCPYHAWVYDIDGGLRRARHTEDLDAFDPAAFGLTPIDVRIDAGTIFLRLTDLPQVPGGLLSPAELAAVRQPYRGASLLPGRAYRDPAVWRWERERWFRHDWLCLGRVDEAAPPAGPLVAEIDG